MKKYKQLFLEIANSTDYENNKLTGASYKFMIDDADKRIYVLLQETKTWLDWLFNLLIIPVKLKNGRGDCIKVPLGNYLQYKSIRDIVVSTIWASGHAASYKVISAGWSQGAVTAALFAFDTYYNSCVLYGCPRFLKRVCDRVAFENTAKYVDFLYPDDWIRKLVPGYCRPMRTVDEGFVPDFEPKSLDDRHRVYGHCTYPEGYEEF